MLASRTYCKYEYEGQAVEALPYPDRWHYLFHKDHFDFLLTDGALLLFVYKKRRLHFEPSYYFMDCPILRPGEALKEYVMPVRYDIDYRGYKEGLHPLGHFHFGLNDACRMATRRILSPAAFVCFILRHFYDGAWAIHLECSDVNEIRRTVRESIQEIGPKWFGKLDYLQHYLT